MKTINRRNFLQISGGIVATSSVSTIALAQQQKKKRPNILFAIADDASHMGAYGHKFVNTPNFDRIASEGILFNNAFTPNPKCSPCRACILTGRQTWQLEEACCHFGVFPSKFKVFPDLLEASGYHVGYTGKGWSPGDWKAGGFKRNPAGNLYSKAKNNPPAKGMSRTDYAENFKLFLKDRKPEQPFSFWYGCHEPHRGYEPGAGLKAGKKLEDAPLPPYYPDEKVVRSDMLDYANEIDWFDTHLGRILKTLEEIGELDNTLIVSTSDNGMPFPRVKGQIYEHDYHLPLAMRWGNVIPENRVVDDLISFLDFAPTFLELAGLKPLPEMMGKSLMNVFKSKKSGVIDPTRDTVFISKERHDVGRPNDVGYPVRAIRTSEYLYVRNFEPDRWPAGDPETGYRNIDGSPTKSRILELKKSGEPKYWDLSMGKRPKVELYNIKKDPACMNNLAENPEYENLKNQLWSKLGTHLKANGDPRINGNGEVFDNYKYTGRRSKKKPDKKKK